MRMRMIVRLSVFGPALFLILGIVAPSRAVDEVMGSIGRQNEAEARELAKLVFNDLEKGLVDDNRITGFPNEWGEAFLLQTDLVARNRGLKKDTPRSDSPVPPKAHIIPSGESGSNADVFKSMADRWRFSQLFVSRILVVSVHLNEGRVRAEIRSRTNERYRSIEDLLMYREKGKWKAFSLQAPSIINVYGFSVPESLDQSPK